MMNFKQFESDGNIEMIFNDLLTKFVEYRKIVKEIDIERGTFGDNDKESDLDNYEYDPNNPKHTQSVEMWQEINNILKENDELFDKFMQYQDETEEENYEELSVLKANILNDMKKINIGSIQ